MLGYNVITSLFRKSIDDVEELPVLEVGTLVWVATLCYGLQLGKVEKIVPSPFYGRDEMTAYVVGNGWSEYLALEGVL